MGVFSDKEDESLRAPVGVTPGGKEIELAK
jgi:hypothetical protein